MKQKRARRGISQGSRLREAFHNRLATVDKTTLLPLVSNVLQQKVECLVDWHCEPVSGGFSHETGEIYGIYRFQGVAHADGKELLWSMILKATGAGSTGSQELDAFDYWKREIEVYRSALLVNLPGDVVAPRCVEIIKYPNEEYWLWLEDIEDLADEQWTFDQYGAVARHLGHFNGAYAMRDAMPAIPWLSAGDFRQRLAMAKPGIAELPTLSQHPYFASFLPGNSVERIFYLWNNRDRLLRARRKLPLTFCHHDAFRRNILTQQDAQCRQKTVLIDWSRAGTGFLGEELVQFFAVSLKFIAVDHTRLAELDKLIFANYIDGLREMGWRGDPLQARLGFTATAALKLGMADPAIKLPSVARRMAALPPDAEPPKLLGPGLAQHLALQEYLLQLGEEAMALAGQLTLRKDV